MYSAICPGCGDLLLTNIQGQVWMGCQNCQWYGHLVTTPTPPSLQGAAAPSRTTSAPALPPAFPPTPAQRTLQCLACLAWTDPAAAQSEAWRLGRSSHWGVCPTCGYGWRVKPSTALAPVPSPNGARAGTPPPPPPPAQPAPTTQPAHHAHHQANQATASLITPPLTFSGYDLAAFAEELYHTLLTTPLAEFRAPLPAQWERLQEALDTLHMALGGRHMGDYAPSEEPVVAAVTRVSVAALLTLWAVAQMRQRELEEMTR